MRKEYGDVLLKQILKYTSLYDISAFDTIFVGGGTPLTMGAEWFLSLRNQLEKRNLIPALKEWTVELNPENIDTHTLSLLSEAGVNRLSVGVQSLDSAVLVQMGRQSNLMRLQERLLLAREYTKNLSIDLIYGMALSRDFEAEMRTLFETVTPNHISCYAYSLPTKNTHLKQSQEASILSEESVISRILGEQRFEQYEVSNWAQPGYESLHNLAYWRSATYLGIGTAAHSYIPSHSTRLHWKNDIAAFIDGSLPVVEQLTKQQEIEEFVLMGLRLFEGVSFERFQNRFGVDFISLFGKTVERLSQDNLLTVTENSVAGTIRGMAILNDILLMLFRELSEQHHL